MVLDIEAMHPIYGKPCELELACNLRENKRQLGVGRLGVWRMSHAVSVRSARTLIG